MTVKYVASVLLLVGSLLGVGCSDGTQPIAAVENVQSDNTTAIQNELSVVMWGSNGLDTAKGIFSIDWQQVLDPQSKSVSLAGNALAVAFDGTQQHNKLGHGGIDIGSVYLNYNGTHQALQKHTMPDGGVAYGTGMPRDNRTNVGFVSDATYEFEVSGSTAFSPMHSSLIAPATLIKISGLMNDQSVNTSSDLTVTWTGGNQVNGVLLTVAAAPPMPQAQGQGPGSGQQGPPMNGRGPIGPGPGAGGPQPPPDSTKAIIVRLDSNTGTYTIASSQLQKLVSKTQTTRLMITVGQMTRQDVAHDGGTVRLMMRNGDGVMVKVQ
jgi:hypothetical protein